ncbi:DUF2849 domain-containing protein [uncultured Pelagimonas sp.]|uniref:DUF2849 domain-containing protein n=1 Tax=uncultured Pelagimonas sp. TaxID=1618102 RepID=UPI00260A0FE8|nr:DUF2849 domain-containing protein [uncultured Pelagimonas sp.]
MAKAFTPKVITANALAEGDVVYLDANDVWVRDLAQADLITDEAVADARLVEASTQHDIVVGVYLADMKAGENGPEPVHFREEFRRRGPSNYFHGKQAAV